MRLLQTLTPVATEGNCVCEHNCRRGRFVSSIRFKAASSSYCDLTCLPHHARTHARTPPPYATTCATPPPYVSISPPHRSPIILWVRRMIRSRRRSWVRRYTTPACHTPHHPPPHPIPRPGAATNHQPLPPRTLPPFHLHTLFHSTTEFSLTNPWHAYSWPPHSTLPCYTHHHHHPSGKITTLLLP